MANAERMLDSRAGSRVRYQVRALLAPTSIQQEAETYFGERIFEVSTKDMSDVGALVLGSRSICVGQQTLFRVGTGSGLVLSLRGQVVRQGSLCPAPHACEWGIQFDDADAELLRHHSVLEPSFSQNMYANSWQAAIVSTNQLEIFWWLGQLWKGIREVFVSTSDRCVLQRLRKAAPHLSIRQLVA